MVVSGDWLPEQLEALYKTANMLLDRNPPHDTVDQVVIEHSMCVRTDDRLGRWHLDVYVVGYVHDRDGDLAACQHVGAARVMSDRPGTAIPLDGPDGYEPMYDVGVEDRPDRQVWLRQDAPVPYDD